VAIAPRPIPCSKYIGDFSQHLDEHGDNIAVNEAAVFVNAKGKLYVYRSVVNVRQKQKPS
jgi:hypothetical protein